LLIIDTWHVDVFDVDEDCDELADAIAEGKGVAAINDVHVG
jgi:hypothetical protein